MKHDKNLVSPCMYNFHAILSSHFIGTIPLRQLVYRVLDLPPSMRPLVYDFGQLNNTTERHYIAQIVQYRCQNIPGVSEQSDIINVVTNVLAWSQNYMRKRNVSHLCY